ncbi:hypothetical protein [Joostella sp.]|uniref:hypothetical protein n=1 Tax=Joostella sp. TaxID=2231138 RepID=UPI003A8C9D11
MKKVMFLVMVAIMPFVACSSDDDNGGQDEIIGKWREVKSIGKEYVEGELVSTEEVTATDEDYSEVEYKADGTFTEFYSESYTSGGEKVVEISTDGGTYEVSGDKIITVYSPDENGENGGSFETQFSISGDILTTFSVDEGVDYEGKSYREEYTTEFQKL